MATDTLSGRLEKLVGAEVQTALAALEAARAEPYYDEAADRSARERYYDAPRRHGRRALRAALAERLERTHDPRPAYKPLQWVYPRVDLHPDGVLRSIYSGKTFSPEELIQADAAVERARTERMLEFNLRETALGPSELRAEAAAIEAALPYNCEHVVPQSWFDEDEPMRGDIHHLFACESGCNSFRGNFPYFDFPDTQEIVRDACGRREDDRLRAGRRQGPGRAGDALLPAPLPGADRRRRAGAHRRSAAMLLAWHEARPGERVRAPPKRRDRRAPGQSQPADRPPGLGVGDRLRRGVGIAGPPPRRRPTAASNERPNLNRPARGGRAPALGGHCGLMTSTSTSCSAAGRVSRGRTSTNLRT